MFKKIKAFFIKIMPSKRKIIQLYAALLYNANLKGYITGKIFTGDSKAACLPGLNCYSCPGAIGSCPIGSLQSFLSGMKFKFPYYVVGLLIFFGAVLGRAVCGFLCPFGFLQDLIYKIPFYKKNKFKIDKFLRYLKYVVLLVLVIILPMTFKLTPFFCKYVCPDGTIAGIMLAAVDEKVRTVLGPLFSWKVILLCIFIVLGLIVRRPFCKYVCPLGAIYGFFNKIALYRMTHDKNKCINCGACAKACQMNIDPVKTPNSMECIRCGECVDACPKNALHLGFTKGKVELKTGNVEVEK